MEVQLTHPYFQKFWLDNNILFARKEKVDLKLRTDVREMAVILDKDRLHLVVIGLDGKLSHGVGKEDMHFSPIDCDFSPQGLNLICDSLGHVHLFYLTRQNKGIGRILRHQIFDGEWTDPMMVTANVNSGPAQYSVCWGEDSYLHLAYCTQTDSRLYYRAFDLTKRIWSGAIPISTEECKHPVLLFWKRLFLFWIEGEKNTSLKCGKKDERWLKAEVLSEQNHLISDLGFRLSRNALDVQWAQNATVVSKTYRDSWNEIIEVDPAQVRFTKRVFAVEGKSLVLPTYDSVLDAEGTIDSVPDEESTTEEARTATESTTSLSTKKDPVSTNKASQEDSDRQVELQQEFIAQAFRLQKEWGDLKETYRQVLSMGSKVEELETKVATLDGKIGEEPDSHELTEVKERIFALREDWRMWRQNPQISAINECNSRLDALERRLRRTQEKEAPNEELLHRKIREMEARLQRLEQRPIKMDKRSEELKGESQTVAKDKKRRSIFSRLLGPKR